MLSENKEEVETAKEVIDEEILREGLKECYELVKDIILEYIDINEKYLPILALWIIGSWIHKEFISFPYLYVNAMRGSAKSRLLGLIMSLTKDGEILISPTEAVLFRQNNPLAIDEFESVGKKEKSTIRELLNASYKKGVKIKRARKVKNLLGEQQVIETFEPYRPIVIANIWGMEEVLEDRCISIILEKSANKSVTKLMEDFLTFEPIQTFKNRLCELFSVGSACRYGKIRYIGWHNYIKTKYTLSTLTTLPTLTYTSTPISNFNEKDTDFFKKIDGVDIDGRNLELFFPLYLIAKIIGEDVLDRIIEVSKGIVKERKLEEYTESRDVLLFGFICKEDYKEEEWVKVKNITNLFKFYVEDLFDEDDKWLNNMWVGRALKRLNLIKEKRRVGEGIEVVIDIKKAQEKIKMFK